MNEVTQAVILAGGRGERLKPFTDDMPKPMYPIDGIPFIERLVLQIKSFGINKIVILLGYLAEKVVNYLGNGDKYGVEIIYDILPLEYDTADRLLHAKNLLEDRFLLMYCDNYAPIDFKRLVKDSFANDSDVQLSVYTNKDFYTKSNVLIGDDGLVLTYDKSRNISNLQGVEIGYSIVKKDALNYIDGKDRNFASAVYPKLILNKKMYATLTEHRYYSIGSFERIELTKEFFKPKRVVFLDRDGTLNVRPPKACYVTKKDEFIWLKGAREAIKLLNDNNVITILVSNQPGIARGYLTCDDLNEIHNKMQSDLSDLNAKIDYIYYCPHNWDEGCDCRKPKPGMLYQAQKDLSLNLIECTLFGDDERDLEAAKNAGVNGVLITEDYPLIDAVKDYLGR